MQSESLRCTEANDTGSRAGIEKEIQKLGRLFRPDLNPNHAFAVLEREPMTSPLACLSLAITEHQQENQPNPGSHGAALRSDRANGRQDEATAALPRIVLDGIRCGRLNSCRVVRTKSRKEHHRL